MGWIKIDKSNFADEKSLIEFSDGAFLFGRAVEGKLDLSAEDIVFLNRQARAERVSGRTDTNILQYLFYGGGAFLAIIIEFFKFFGVKRSPKTKRRLNAKIIVKFNDEKALSGKTDFDTFFAIQNAWLDSK